MAPTYSPQRCRALLLQPTILAPGAAVPSTTFGSSFNGLPVGAQCQGGAFPDSGCCIVLC